MWLDDIDPAFGHWFAGFVDGEGSFMIKRHVKRERAARGAAAVSYVCLFGIGLRNDDKPILEEIRAVLNMGSVTTYSHSNPSGGLVSTFKVYRQSDVVRLTALLDRFPLRAKKAVDFEIWRRACEVWLAYPPPSRSRTRDWSAMEALYEELKEARRREAPYLRAARVDPQLSLEAHAMIASPPLEHSP